MQYFTEHKYFDIIETEHSETIEHDHEFLEFVYVLKGSATYFLDGKRMQVSGGDYFIVDYKMRHQYRCARGESIRVVNYLFRPELIDISLAGCRSLHELFQNHLIRMEYAALSDLPTNVIFHDNGTMYPLLARIREEYDTRRPGYYELIRALLIEVLILIARSLVKDYEYRARRDSTRFITDYVDEHYMEQITLSALAQSLHFSLPYLSQKFQRDTGTPFHTYLQQVRIRQSCRLLANTEKKVSEVATLCGYNDMRFFQQVFKRHMNMTAREYRKTCRSI